VTNGVVDRAKLDRLVSSARQLVEEPLLDEEAREFAAAAFARLVVEVGSSLSDTVLDELGRLIPHLPGDCTVGELRVLEAQLVGWLDGVIEAEKLEVT
jgi:hypothetical protein